MQPVAPRIAALPAVFVLPLALAAIACVLVAPTAAQASHVHCGDTITADTTLDSDLVDCPNNGVVIGADGITLDLDGHLIDGDGTLFAECPERTVCDAGVLIDEHDRITIRNGSVREFAVGVFVGRSTRSQVVGISSTKHELFGALLAESSKSEIRNSSLSRNIAPEGDGLGMFGSDRNKIKGNEIEDNPGPGIHIQDSAGNLVKKNRMAKNGPAILIEADGNEVRHNRVARGGGILLATGDDNVVVGNRVSRTGDSLSVENGSGNLVARNVVTEARGNGINLGLGGPPIGGGHNIVRRNLVKRSAEDGFHVYAKDGHSLLKRNVSVGAEDDGFEIQSRTAKLTANRALHSADLGIRAVPGVIDGGRNAARRSGDSRECTNIHCD